jgi:hypothetical protein
MIQFSPEIVYHTIRGLPLSTSEDIDGLSYLMIKKNARFLSEKLSKLFKFSLSAGKIPQNWKKIVITPIHKSGPRNLCGNYRPIAVTSCILRIMERIIAKQMIDFLRDCNSIFPSQHGFLPNGSIETAGITFLDHLTRNLDNGLLVDVAFLDYSKAFDSVPHGRLLHKLALYGFSGVLLSWLTDYLSNRTQLVRILNCYSTPRNVTSGVIQGSALGPVLFVLYINDLDTHISEAFTLKYADDVKVAISSRKDVSSQIKAIDTFQADLNNIQRWSEDNHLSLNANKTKLMCFGRSGIPRNFSIGGNNIEQVVTFKDLGILIGSPFNFKAHMSTACLKANRTLGVLKKVFVSRNRNLMLTLYKSQVRPLLEFGSILWCPYHMNGIELLEKVQKRFCRFFSTLSQLDYKEKLSNLGLMSLKARRLRYRLIFMYKIIHNKTCLNAGDFFRFSERLSGRGNVSSRIILPYANRDYRRHFFTIEIVNHWNALTQNELMAQSVPEFKRSIKSYFIRNDIW